MIEQLEKNRRQLSISTSPEKKSEMGQFMTPAPIASFMAGLFNKPLNGKIRLLDSGAGIGSLSIAFAERWRLEWSKECLLDIDAFEIDGRLVKRLKSSFKAFRANLNGSSNAFGVLVQHQDFIETSSEKSWEDPEPRYTHAILNPPYKKINRNSKYRRLLRVMGVETVNLYSGFLETAINQVVDGGEIVAIVPRSFCNGPYYEPFRKALIEKTGIIQMHLFDTRNSAFKDDSVLQENVILHLEKGRRSKRVMITTSFDSSFEKLSRQDIAFTKVVLPKDRNLFIRFPSLGKQIKVKKSIQNSLSDIGVKVSTGPVVDFRAETDLRKTPKKNDALLIYPAHFDNWRIKCPKENFKKSNGIAINSNTQKNLYPKGYYTLVRRFSSKEERRRIFSVVFEPKVTTAKFVGFENHVNVFHGGKCGLSRDMAWGLMTYVNSKYANHMFKEFSGHTQVNVSDLKALKYPNRLTLERIGEMARQMKNLSEDDINQLVDRIK